MVREELGRGGMGIVYRCYDRKLNKDVAVKVIGYDFSDDAILRFHKEAKTLAKLHHRNILGVSDFDYADDDKFFLSMDLLPGRSLADLIEQEKLPPFEDALEIFIQICAGLAHAHSKGILHRDIKPSNVFVARYKAGTLQVVITDFGIAKLLDEDQAMTAAGVSMGSPPYMSPEQCDGKPTDARSDLYSLGCLMFEALAGSRPFLGETVPHLLMQHISEQPPKLRERAPDYNFPEEMDRIISKCLAKNPDERYANAKLLSADLQQLRDSICNVSFAQHSEESGAYKASKNFLRTGAFLITGYQNLTRPENEKKLIAALIAGFLIIATSVGVGVTSLKMEWDKDEKQKQIDDGFQAKDADQTGLTLNPTASSLEPKRLRETKLWIVLDKDVKSALKEIRIKSEQQIGFEKGVATPDWLDLKGSDLKDDDLKEVESLKVRGYILKDTGVTDKALQILSKVDSLAELFLENTKITDKGLSYLNENANQNLTLITLSGTGITDAGIREISKYSKLAWAGLENCKNIRGDNIELLHNNSDLFHLGLSGSGFKLENLPKLSKVKMGQLDISNLNLKDSDLATIAANPIPGLITLNINNNKEVTDQGLLKIAGLKGLSSLHIVGCDKITKAGIASFHNARGDMPVAIYQK